MNTRIKELRLSKGLSQLALAMKVGCSQNTISRIELGLSEPNSTILLNIAAYFNTSVDYLLHKYSSSFIVAPLIFLIIYFAIFIRPKVVTTYNGFLSIEESLYFAHFAS